MEKVVSLLGVLIFSHTHFGCDWLDQDFSCKYTTGCGFLLTCLNKDTVPTIVWICALLIMYTFLSFTSPLISSPSVPSASLSSPLLHPFFLYDRSSSLYFLLCLLYFFPLFPLIPTNSLPPPLLICHLYLPSSSSFLLFCFLPSPFLPSPYQKDSLLPDRLSMLLQLSEEVNSMSTIKEAVMAARKREWFMVM